MNSNVIKFKPRGGDARKKRVHPIDRRLAELGQKRSWLAAKTGLTPQQIGNYCRGVTLINPNSVTTYKLKKALGVNLDYLIIGPLYRDSGKA